MLASYDRAYAERDKTESGSYVQEYVNHFLEGEPSPGIDYEQKLVQALLPTITGSRRGHGAAKSMFDDTSRVILAVSPQKGGREVPTDAQLRRRSPSADAGGGDAVGRHGEQRRSDRARAGSRRGRRPA